MKTKIFTLILLMVISVSTLFSQYEIRNLPFYLDYNWHTKPADYVRTAHLKPYPMPEYAYKLPKGPARIQSESGVELVNISNANSHQSEVFISVNSTDPNNIIVGTNDYRFNSRHQGYRMASFYSTDGGNSFTESLLPKNLDIGVIEYPSNGGATCVDPGIGFDSEGNAYYIYLFAQLIDGADGDNGIFVARSTDKGKTWPIDGIGAPIVNYNDALQDKCFIAVDSDPNSPYANRAYAAWFDTKYPFGIAFSYAPEGIDFEGVSTITGSAGKSIQSPLPVVAPDGVLYVTWEEKIQSGAVTKAMVQKSTDGGVSWAWSTPKVAQVVNTCGDIVGHRRAFPDKADMRISSHTYMDVDPNTGYLYLVQAGKDENAKYGVFMSISKDGGETWSGPSAKAENLIKIDGNTFGNDVFLPSVAVDPVTGMVAVLYYSSENDPENNRGCDAFVAVSFDEGGTFKHIQLTDTWYFGSSSVIDAGGDNLGRYWGDYTSIDAYDGKIHPCFWMPTSQNADFWSCDLFTAKLSTNPNPPADLGYTIDAENPNTVIINWIDPTENLLGGPLGDFTVVITKNGQEVGEVDKGVQTFTDNNATPGENFTYYLKTKLTSSGQLSDLASISGVAGGVLEPKVPENIMPMPSSDGIFVTWTNPVEHIDDTYLYDLDAIEFYVDDALVKTVGSNEIQAGEQSSTTLELETEEFYTLKLRAKTKRGEYSGESVFSQEFIAYSGAPLTEFEENFDDVDNLTPSYITSNWGITSDVSYSPSNCLTDSPDGKYDNGSHYKIFFAPMVISEGKTTLQMKHIGLIQKQDIGIVSVSNNFGQKYEGIIHVNINMSEGWDNSGYDVNQSEWFTHCIDLNEYLGDTLFVRFEMLTSPLSNKDGWYIDDLMLGECIPGVEENYDLSKDMDVVVSPNPAAEFAKINFRMFANNNLTIEVIDNLGRKIQTIENDNYTIGNYSLDITTDSMTNGIYYIKLNVGGQSDIVPLVVNK